MRGYSAFGRMKRGEREQVGLLKVLGYSIGALIRSGEIGDPPSEVDDLARNCRAIGCPAKKKKKSREEKHRELHELANENGAASPKEMLLPQLLPLRGMRLRVVRHMVGAMRRRLSAMRRPSYVPVQ